MAPSPSSDRGAAFGPRGVGIVAVMLIVMVLTLMGGVIATIVASGALGRTNDLVRERSFALVHAGFEYALKRISEGVNPDGQVKALAGGEFTVGYQGSGLITVTSDVTSLQGQANPTFTIQGPTSQGSMGNCLVVSTSGWYLSNVNKDLNGLTLRNGCQVPITVASMVVSWNPAGTRRLLQVRIQNSTVFNLSQGIPSGSLADIADHAIPACTTHALTHLRFDGAMTGTNFTIQFNMLDGTSRTAFVQAVSNNQAACLNVDVGAVRCGQGGYVALLGGTLTNACAAPTTIQLNQMTIAITPNNISPRLQGIDFGAAPAEWSGNLAPAAGTWNVALSTPVSLSPGTSVAQSAIAFDRDLRGHNWQITYRMQDGSSQLASVNLYETNMASCIRVDNSSAVVSAARLSGQRWTNSCPLRALVSALQTTWTTPARQLYTVTANGTVVYDGSANSGAVLNIDDVEIPGGSGIPINGYDFSGPMSGACFTHTLTPYTGGSVSVPSYCR